MPLQTLAVSANMPEVPNPTFGPAANLINGDPSTSAYPGSASLDYTIDPGQAAYIERGQEVAVALLHCIHWYYLVVRAIVVGTGIQKHYYDSERQPTVYRGPIQRLII
jgi:hypothetical protein